LISHKEISAKEETLPAFHNVISFTLPTSTTQRSPLKQHTHSHTLVWLPAHTVTSCLCSRPPRGLDGP